MSTFLKSQEYHSALQVSASCPDPRQPYFCFLASQSLSPPCCLWDLLCPVGSWFKQAPGKAAEPLEQFPSISKPHPPTQGINSRCLRC